MPSQHDLRSHAHERNLQVFECGKQSIVASKPTNGARNPAHLLAVDGAQAGLGGLNKGIHLLSRVPGGLQVHEDTVSSKAEDCMTGNSNSSCNIAEIPAGQHTTGQHSIAHAYLLHLSLRALAIGLTVLSWLQGWQGHVWRGKAVEGGEDSTQRALLCWHSHCGRESSAGEGDGGKKDPPADQTITANHKKGYMLSGMVAAGLLLLCVVVAFCALATACGDC